MNTTVFFDAIRQSLFGGSLTEAQVHGMQSLLDAGRDYGLLDEGQMAYVLAGVFHETGRLMRPVREGFAKTDAEARAAVARLKAQGRIKTNYALPVKGVAYYGRGRIQNTHLGNYQKLEKRFGMPFVTKPDLLLEDEIDAKVTVAGHAEGIWTGKKLSDYISGSRRDFTSARRIVNGTDKAAMIASYAQKFLSALHAAGWAREALSEPATTSLGGAPLVDFSHFHKGTVYPRLKEAQRLLRDKGYADVGNIDGKWGSLSRNTLNAFRADNGMDPDPTGALIENTIAALKASLDKVLPPERSQATVAEVEPKSPIIQQTQKASWWAKLTGWLGSGGMVALGVKDVMPVTLAGFAPYKEYLPAIPPWFWLLLALVVAAVITIGTIIATRKNANVSEIKTEEYRTGGRA